MYAEADLLPLSALQHLLFCERQCALIHIERLWLDNALTVEGHHLHERVDAGISESRRDLRIVRSMWLRSNQLGLIGKADIVEFHRRSDASDGGVRLDGRPGRWLPHPVEYKRGKPKRDLSDKVQLCAQAMCLEEGLGVPVPRGAVFYGRTRRRLVVEFDQTLRAAVVKASVRLHELVREGRTPPGVKEAKCERCSLLPVCLPAVSELAGSAVEYLEKAL